MKRYRVTPTAVIPEDPEHAQSFPELPETEIGLIGQYAQEGDRAIVDDFIRKPGAPLAVFGGNIQLAGGLDINIFKPLRVWRSEDGAQFEDFNDAVTVINLATADATDPRIDLVYVTLAEDADGAFEQRHLSKDPTDPGALVGETEIAAEKQNTLTIAVVEGMPAPDPQVPTLPPNSAYMYRVIVPAGAINLTGDSILDLRHNFLTLEEIAELVDGLIDDVNTIKDNKHRHPADQVDIGPGAGKYSNMTDQQAWNLLGSQSDAKQEDVVFRPETITPELAPSATGSGKLGSAPTTDGSTPVVDIPVGRQVSFFGGSLRTIEPGGFPAVVEGISINARYVNKHVDEATNSRSHSIDLTLATISAIQSDGGGDLELLGYALPSPRARSYAGQRMACAFSATKIVLMGGAPGGGDSAVYEIDTVAQTVTQRILTGDVPNFFIRGVFPCGDGVNVIAAQQPGADGGFNGAKLEWFLVNMSTLVSTKFTGTAPGYTADPVGGGPSSAVIGDLIAPNVILLMINTFALAGDPGPSDCNAYENRLWVYHVDSGTFEKFTPTGQNPLTGLTLSEYLQDVDVCMYQPGQAVLVRGRFGVSTHIFDYATRSWTKLNISQPSADLNQVYGSTLNGLTMANVNGRPQLTSEASSIWELTPSVRPQWDNRGIAPGFGAIFGATSFGRGYVGYVGLLKGGLPNGEGYVLGGRVSNSTSGSGFQIWRFQAGGIVETSCNGVTGLTLGGGATVASFVVDDGYTLPWQVASVVANPIGTMPSGSIKLEIQFNNEAWQEITRDVVKTVICVGATPVRRWRITLFGTGASKPCISKLNELFETTGGPGFTQLVLRYNVIQAGVRYLYMSRLGVITIEATAQMTTPDKAILTKISPNGSSAPTVLDFVNKRLIHRKYTGTRASGQTPAIANDFPVLPAYIKAWLKAAGGGISDLADPTVDFNTPIAVNGLTVDGQLYIVELEA